MSEITPAFLILKPGDTKSNECPSYTVITRRLCDTPLVMTDVQIGDGVPDHFWLKLVSILNHPLKNNKHVSAAFNK